jgi:hypothetical protein
LPWYAGDKGDDNKASAIAYLSGDWFLFLVELNGDGNRGKVESAAKCHKFVIFYRQVL